MKNVKDFITYYIYLKGSYDNLITTKPGTVELGATTRETYCVVEDFDSLGWSDYNNKGVWYTDEVWGSMELGDFTYTYHKSHIDNSVTLYTGFAQWLFSPKERGYKEAKEDYKFVVYDYEGFEDYKVRWKARIAKWEAQREEERLTKEREVKNKFESKSKEELSEIVDILYGVCDYKGFSNLTEALDYMVSLFRGES